MSVNRMRALKVGLIIIIIAAMAPAAVSAPASVPDAKSGLMEASIALGQIKTFSLVDDGHGHLVLVPVSASQGNSPTLSFKFADWGSQRVLITKNGYSSVLHFKARICVSNPTRCADTSIIPVAPRISSYESWSDPIEYVIVSGFSLTNK